ncbi:MAG: hypothetical protein AAF754_08505 [Pseudomonadota bacterium]
MKSVSFSASLVLCLFGGPLLATPIQAISSLGINNSYTVNNGSVPEGIRLENVVPSLSVSGDVQSSVDDPAATTTTANDTVVGNPFLDPPRPFSANRLSTTTLPGSAEGSTAFFGIEIETEHDADVTDPITSIVSRSTKQSGGAQASISSAPVAAAAFSEFENERAYRFENTTNAEISFVIDGIIDANLLAFYDGTDGFARATGTAYTLFENAIDASAFFAPLTPYVPLTSASNDSASAVESLVANSDGISLSVAASALGDGSDPLAEVELEFGYFFLVTLDGGGSIDLRTGFSQRNEVQYNPQIAAVPLPAGLPLLLFALAALSGLRARH